MNRKLIGVIATWYRDVVVRGGERLVFCAAISCVAILAGLAAIVPIFQRDARFTYSWVVLIPFQVEPESGQRVVLDVRMSDTALSLDFGRNSGDLSETLNVILVSRGLSGCTIGDKLVSPTYQTEFVRNAPYISPYERRDITIKPRTGRTEMSCAFYMDALPFVVNDTLYRQQFALYSVQPGLRRDLNRLHIPNSATALRQYSVTLPESENPDWHDGVPVHLPTGETVTEERVLDDEQPGVTNVAYVQYSPRNSAKAEEIRLMFGGVLFGIAGQGIFELLATLFGLRKEREAAAAAAASTVATSVAIGPKLQASTETTGAPALTRNSSFWTWLAFAMFAVLSLAVFTISKANCTDPLTQWSCTLRELGPLGDLLTAFGTLILAATGVIAYRAAKGQLDEARTAREGNARIARAREAAALLKEFGKDRMEFLFGFFDWAYDIVDSREACTKLYQDLVVAQRTKRLAINPRENLINTMMSEMIDAIDDELSDDDQPFSYARRADEFKNKIIEVGNRCERAWALMENKVIDKTLFLADQAYNIASSYYVLEEALADLCKEESFNFDDFRSIAIAARDYMKEHRPEFDQTLLNAAFPRLPTRGQSPSNPAP